MENNNRAIEIRERKLVASKDAEQQCLGLCLKSNNCISIISGVLTPEDFNWKENQHIFNVILDLFNSNYHVDQITVSDELNKRGLLEAAKGRPYIYSLVDIASASDKAQEYAERVREWSALRKIIETNENINAKIKSGDPVSPSEIINDQSRNLINISDRITRGGFSSSNELHNFLYNDLNEAYLSKKDLLGISSGFSNLDYMTGGFQPGDMVVVAALSSVGKTALSIQLAAHCATELRLPAAIFSLEMRKELLMYRLIAAEAHVNTVKMRRGDMSNSEWIRVQEALQKLKESPLLIDDTSGSSILEIKSKTNKLLQKHGSLGMVVIDYFDLIRSSRKSGEGHEQLAALSWDIQEYTKSLPCPVITVARLNRNSVGRKDKTPIISDLAGTARLGYDADTLIFLHRPSYHEAKKEVVNPNDPKSNSLFNEEESSEDKEVKLILEKCRNGPTGVVNLEFEKKFGIFTQSNKRY